MEHFFWGYITWAMLMAVLYLYLQITMISMLIGGEARWPFKEGTGK